MREAGAGSNRCAATGVMRRTEVELGKEHVGQRWACALATYM